METAALVGLVRMSVSNLHGEIKRFQEEEDRKQHEEEQLRGKKFTERIETAYEAFQNKVWWIPFSKSD